MDGNERLLVAGPFSALRAERHLFSVNCGVGQRSLFNLYWGKHGRFMIDFPYFEVKRGLLTSVVFRAHESAVDVPLGAIGHTATHHVKYSHAADGRAHFSQHGYDSGLIGTDSIPLNEQGGHMFTILLRGLDHFAATSSKHKRPPTTQRATLTWDIDDMPDRWIKIHGEWRGEPGPWLVRSDGSVVPRTAHEFTVGSDGHERRRSAFAGGPTNWPLGDRGVMLTMESIKLGGDGVEGARLIFLGGFDDASVVADLEQDSTAIAFLYNPSDFDILRNVLPTTDEKRSERGTGISVGPTLDGTKTG